MHYFDMNLNELRIKIDMAHSGTLPASWKWDYLPYNQPFQMILWLVTQNGGRLTVGDEVHALKQGDSLIMDTTTPKCGRHNPDQPMSLSYVVFNLLNPDGKHARQALDELAGRHKVRHYAFVQDLAARCVNSFEASGNRGPAGRWMKCLLQELLDQQVEVSANRAMLPMEQRIAVLCKTIGEHPELKYNVADMARQTGCGTDHFIRTFKTFKGTTPGAFILKTRLDAAQRHLMMSSMRISEIACLLGYSNPYFFSRQFRKHIGVSPLQYRKLN